MEKLSLDDLGQNVSRKRGSMGIRAAAAEIGISPATLSRIERGHVPDVKTLAKICDWLGVEPGRYLGTPEIIKNHDDTALEIAFKKGGTFSQQTSKSLANLIMAAHDEFTKTIKAEGH